MNQYALSPKGGLLAVYERIIANAQIERGRLINLRFATLRQHFRQTG
jgi:hypothetical protein